MPSNASLATLAVSTGLTCAIIYHVHHSQMEDRAKLRRGIERDLERQHMRRTENIKRLQDQQELAKAYKLRQQEHPKEQQD